jgi:transposase-like protein
MVATNKSEMVVHPPLACADEAEAVAFFEDARWGKDPACVHCGSLAVYQMRDRAGARNARWLWRCKDCGRQFTVRVGTILEDSPIPLRHWAYAFWAACASKKGVSALQIQRQTGLTYKSALFMMHRVRWSMDGGGEPGGMLRGAVEVDETYVGGKPRHAAGSNPRAKGRNPETGAAPPRRPSSRWSSVAAVRGPSRSSG